jgi:hypothetical protein
VVATGLHQLVFHPFFVAPFLLWKFRNGERKQVLIYGAAYAAIILWWAIYPAIAGREVASPVQHPPHTSFIALVEATFAHRRGDTAISMALNLVRFFAWQNIALLPLLAAAVAVAVRNRGLPATLLLAISLWLGFIAVVIPFQGHGWGYRYLHPYLGSFALLAGYGFRELRETIGRRADGFVLIVSGVTAVATIPLLFTASHRFVSPYLALERLVAIQKTPMVLIDTESRRTTNGQWAGNAVEVVRNEPDLSNRPLRFSSRNMTPQLLVDLCALGQVTVIGSVDQQRAGFAPHASVNSPRFTKLIAAIRRQRPDCLLSAKGTIR